MPRHSGKPTGANTPLRLAETISKLVNKEWLDGTFVEKVSGVTADLLRFWDPKGSFADLRNVNFHEGQWQAILNAVYVHEVLKVKDVRDLYMSVRPELLQELDITILMKDKHVHPKYCIKMATGTGKTWVMSSLLIWQFLNAKHEEVSSGRFSKNFLLVAPGDQVYERLLDAWSWKEKRRWKQRFSDFRFQDLRESVLTSGLPRRGSRHASWLRCTKGGYREECHR